MKLARPWVGKEGRSWDNPERVHIVTHVTVHRVAANTSQVRRDTESPQPLGITQGCGSRTPGPYLVTRCLVHFPRCGIKI